jgi:hypothetical protein
MYKLSQLGLVDSLLDLLLLLAGFAGRGRVGGSVHQIRQIRLIVATGFADGLQTVGPLHPLCPVGSPLSLLRPPALLSLTSQVDIELRDPGLIDEDGAGEMLDKFARGQALPLLLSEAAVCRDVDVVADPEELLLPDGDCYYNCRQA